MGDYEAQDIKEAPPIQSVDKIEKCHDQELDIGHPDVTEESEGAIQRSGGIGTRTFG